MIATILKKTLRLRKVIIVIIMMMIIIITSIFILMNRAHDYQSWGIGQLMQVPDLDYLRQGSVNPQEGQGCWA